MNSSTGKTDVLQEIIRMKQMRKEEIAQSKKKMQGIIQAIIEPEKPSHNGNQMMRYVHTGMAAYDGLMTGIKVYRRIKRLFSKRTS